LARAPVPIAIASKEGETVVVVTSVEPCHSPVVKPPQVCGAYFDGCGRPSIQIVRSARRKVPPTL